MLDELAKTQIFKPAFVQKILHAKADVVFHDISNLMRKDSSYCDTWHDFILNIRKRCLNGFLNANTLVYLCDSPMFVPQSKAIESMLRSKSSKQKNGIPITKLSKTELEEECIVQRKNNLPDMKRLFITPGMKEWLTWIYADTLKNEINFPTSVNPVKTLIVDGVVESINPLHQPSGDPPGTYIKRSSNNISFCSENLSIGESDLRWIRWIKRICTGNSLLWGKHDSTKDKPVFVLDINDSDALPIALINMVCFIDEATGEFPCELYMYAGVNGKWTDFFVDPNNTIDLSCIPGDDDDDDDKKKETNDKKKKKKKKAGKMIDLIKFWNILIDEFGVKMGIQHPIETFCALILLGGSDYVKSINNAGVISTGAPFKGFGPHAIMTIFMNNERARQEFCTPINIPCWKNMIGQPMQAKHLYFSDEWSMLCLVKRYYQKLLNKHGLSDCKGELIDSFASIAEAKMKHHNGLQMAKQKKKKKKTQENIIQQPVQLMELASQSGILTEHQARAIIRRILWNLDYFMNGGTGNYNIESAVMINGDGVSVFGWLINRDKGCVELASRVA